MCCFLSIIFIMFFYELFPDFLINPELEWVVFWADKIYVKNFIFDLELDKEVLDGVREEYHHKDTDQRGGQA